jgi:hypothetical protein
MFSFIFNVLVFIFKKATKLKRWNVSFLVHLNFLQSPHYSFILLSYVDASTLALVDLCSIPPSLEPRTHYYPDVKKSLTMKREKLMFRMFLDFFFAFDYIAFVLNGLTTFPFSFFS